MRIITHTLGYNTVDNIINQSVRSCLQKEHYVVDLGFPLRGDGCNVIDENKLNNSHELLVDCSAMGFNYMKPARNRGCSPNWDFVFRETECGLDDVLCGIEPDEIALNTGWVQAMADVIRADRQMALVSLNTDGHNGLIEAGKLAGHKTNIGGHNVLVVNGLCSWAMIGFNGRFLHRMGGIPTPKGADIYGHIESGCYQHILDGGYRWCILLDYFCQHTDDIPLYRSWKTDVTSGKYTSKEQIQFDEWLRVEKGFV